MKRRTFLGTVVGGLVSLFTRKVTAATGPQFPDPFNLPGPMPQSIADVEPTDHRPIMTFLGVDFGSKWIIETPPAPAMLSPLDEETRQRIIKMFRQSGKTPMPILPFPVQYVGYPVLLVTAWVSKMVYGDPTVDVIVEKKNWMLTTLEPDRCVKQIIDLAIESKCSAIMFDRRHIGSLRLAMLIQAGYPMDRLVPIDVNPYETFELALARATGDISKWDGLDVVLLSRRTHEDLSGSAPTG